MAAFFVDYFVFIVPLLGVLSLGGWALWSSRLSPPLGTPWLNQTICILVLMLPIVLYFALAESSRWQATIGKRILGVMVVDSNQQRAKFKQTTIRAILKFLPWELFHTIYWRWEGWPTNPAPPSSVQIAAMTFGWIVIAWFIVSLFIGTRRTPYDRVAGTRVVNGWTTPTATEIPEG